MVDRTVRKEIGMWPKGNKVAFMVSSPDGKYYVIDIAGYNKSTLPKRLQGKFTSEVRAKSVFDQAVREYKSRPKGSNVPQEEEVTAVAPSSV